MSRNYDKITRRRFLGLGAAGVAIAALSRGSAGEALGSTLMADAKASKSGYRLFSEGRIADLRTTNRLIRSATAEGASPDGRMNAEGLKLYEQLAQGGVGLIITGHIVAAHGGDDHGKQTHLDDDMYIEAAKSIADTVHRQGPGCKVVAQLSHAGPNALVDPIGPSEASTSRNGTSPRVLSIGEIDNLIEQFAASIRRAKEAGFDGIEIHGAHGYLLSSFLSPKMNQRDDEYGGSAARRASIIAKIVSAARRDVGSGFPVLIKVNCDDHGEDESAITGFAEMVRELEKAGVDAIDVSGMMAIRLRIDEPAKEAYFLPFAERARLKVPVILTGGHRSIARMESILQQGNVQFLAMARPLLREPDLPRRLLEGSSTAATCISCNRCLRGLGTAPTHCRQLEA